MKYITLNSDYKMPVIGLGTWKSPLETVYQAVRWAIKSGYCMIDCASIYGNEAVVGQALHDAMAEGDIKRKDLFVTSKLWNDSHKPADVRPALERSLKDLQLDYLDLYLIHWPIAVEKDGTPIPVSTLPSEMTWAEMEKIKNDGMARSIGVSNFSEKELTHLLNNAEIVPAVNQVEVQPYFQQNELIDFCNHHNISVTAYAPLGSPDRPQEMKETDEPRPLEDGVIAEIAARSKASPAQVILAWLIHRGLSVIPKSVNYDRIDENLAALDVSLDAEDMEKIAALDSGKRLITGKELFGGDYTYQSVWN